MEPIAECADRRVVESVDEVENLERRLGIDRLTVQTSLVRFQGVSEPAVRVSVGAQGVNADSLGAPSNR